MNRKMKKLLRQQAKLGRKLDKLQKKAIKAARLTSVVR